MSYSIRLYPDQSNHASETATAATEREARRIAARMLGHRTLRGSSQWDRFEGGTVYQFGPHEEDNGYDFVVIEEVSQ